MAKSKEKTSKVSLLLVIGVIFYIVAFLNLLSLLSIFAENVKILFNISWSEDFYRLIESSYEFDRSLGEFLSFQKTFSTLFDSAVLFVWGTVFIACDRVRKRKDKQKKEKEEKERQEQLKTLEIKEPEPEHYFCAYCDSELLVTDMHCPHCGATKKIKKNNSNKN